METTDKALESHKSLIHGPIKYLRQGIVIVDDEITFALGEIERGETEAAKERLKWVQEALDMWVLKDEV